MASSADIDRSTKDELEQGTSVTQIYDHLWKKVVKTKEEQAKFKTHIDGLVNYLEADVIPEEQKLGRLLTQLIDKLLSFTERRAMSELHRNELHVWIQENVQQLKDMGLADPDVCDRAAVVHARYKNIPIDRDMPQSIAEQVDSYYSNLREANQRPDDSVELNQDATQAVASAKLENETYANSVECRVNAVGDVPEGSQSGSPGINLDVMDDSVFQRIFRQTANALHPDKEPNEELRLAKQELMSELLESRKRYDLIAVMAFYEQFVSDRKQVTEEDKRSLATVLHHYLRHAQNNTEPMFESRLHAVAYLRYYANREVERNEKLANHLASLHIQSEQCVSISQSVNTLFRLCYVLDKRIALKTAVRNHQAT